MTEPLKAVNFYKRDLTRGCLHNLAADGELCLHPADGARPAAYVTRMFDTCGPDMTFNRLKVEGAFEGVRLEVIAVSNCVEAVIEGGPVSLDEWLGDPSVDREEKARALCALPHVRAAQTCSCKP